MSSIFTYVKNLSLRTKMIATAVVIVVVALLVLVVTGGKASTDSSDVKVPEVEVKTVAELSSNVSPLSLLGTVISRSEATLFAETPGRITGVYRSLGDSVGAGAVIAEVENSRERAAVLQAKGSYDAAKASYEKVVGNAGQNRGTSKEAAMSALFGAYAGIDDAITKKTDENFSNPTSGGPQFLVTSNSSSVVYDVQNKRHTIQGMLEANATAAIQLSADTDLSSEFARVQDDMQFIRTYLDSLVDALNRGIPSASVTESTIATYKADASAARSAIAAALASLTAAEQVYNAQVASLGSSTGGIARDVEAAEGSLKAAEGTLAVANANLEKTIIRAPFSGTLNMLDAHIGDFASAGKAVATIANNGSLEIVASITETDRAALKVGGTAIVNNEFKAVITKIAPAVDPKTKKIEVRLALTDGNKLTNGSSVRVMAARAASADKNTKISIPITSLKITPEGPAIFTVASSTLVMHPVTIGPLSGDKVIITEGLTPEMEIVVDARGLKDGEHVVIK